MYGCDAANAHGPPQPRLPGRQPTFALMQRAGVSRFADFAEVAPSAIVGAPVNICARYSLLTFRQYKLCLTDRRPEACAEWLGASVRVTLRYADACGGGPVLGRLPAGSEIGGVSSSPKRKRPVPGSGPLLCYTPGGKGCSNSLPQTSSAEEVVLTIGPDGVSEAAFGFHAATHCHGGRRFALRLEATGRDGDWMPTVGALEVTTRAHRSQDTGSVAEPVCRPKPRAPRERRAPRDEAARRPPPSSSTEIDLTDSDAGPDAEAEAGGGAAPEPDLVALIDRLPLVDLEGLPCASAGDGEAGEGGEEGGGEGRSGPGSPEKAFGKAAGGGASSSPSSAASGRAPPPAPPRAPAPAPRPAPADAPDPYGEEGSRRWWSILDDDPLMPAEDIIPDRPWACPVPAAPAASPPSEENFDFMDPVALRGAAPGSAFAPSPSRPPSVHAAAAAAPVSGSGVERHADSVLPAAMSVPREEAQALAARCEALAAACGRELAREASLRELREVLLDPRLLASDLCTTAYGQFRFHRLLCDLCGVGGQGLVAAFVSSAHSALVALPSQPDLSPSGPLAAAGVDPASSPRAILDFLKVAMGPASVLPLDFTVISEEQVAQLLDKSRLLIDAAAESPAARNEIASLHIEWLVRKGVFDFMHGRQGSGVEGLWQAWSELIRRQLSPCRLETRVIATLLSFVVLVPSSVSLLRDMASKVYWFEEGAEDARDEAVCYQGFSALELLRHRFAEAAGYATRGIEAWQRASATGPEYRQLAIRTLQYRMYASLRMERLASAAQDWKLIFTLLKETCGVNSHYWDVLYISRFMRQSMPQYPGRSCRDTVRLFRAFFVLIKITDGASETPLRGHALMRLGECYLIIGARERAAACFEESIALLQGRFPLCFTDAHPRIASIRALLEVARGGLHPSAAPSIAH
eukprot:tig00020556_g11006.t1